MTDRNSPRAAIFDMDGTLVDNMPYHIETWRALLRDNGIEISVAEYYASGVGGSAEEVVRHFLGSHLSDPQAAALAAQKEFLYRYLARRRLKPLRGLRRALAAGRRFGLSMAVATSAGAKNTDFLLDSLKLRPYFDTVLVAGDVTKNKPHPDIFLAAAQRLGIAPEMCVVFEDSHPGLDAALSAGMRAVALTTAHPKSELAQRVGVIRVIDDYTQFSWLDLWSEVIR